MDKASLIVAEAQAKQRIDGRLKELGQTLGVDLGQVDTIVQRPNLKNLVTLRAFASQLELIAQAVSKHSRPEETVTLDELSEIKGVGKATAQAILELLEAKGMA